MIELILGGFLAFILLITLTWFVFRPRWMGFADKTLFDWMTMLSLPFMIGFGAGGIGMIQREIELTRTEELAVQQYIDRISAAYSTSESVQTSQAVIRAQTKGILRLVSGERAGRVLAFLHDLDALETIAPQLEFLDLAGIELKGLSLRNFDFEGSDLRGAELEDADMSGADFEESDLRRADLKDTDLRGADFEYASMKGTDLDHADLRGADLSLARDLNPDQLAQACVDETTILPQGIRLAELEVTGCSGRAEDD